MRWLLTATYIWIQTGLGAWPGCNPPELPLEAKEFCPKGSNTFFNNSSREQGLKHVSLLGTSPSQ